MTCPLTEYLPLYIDEHSEKLRGHIVKCSDCQKCMDGASLIKGLTRDHLAMREPVGGHPSFKALFAFPNNSGREEAEKIREHLSNCNICASVVSTHTKLRRAKSDVPDFNELLKQADEWLKSLDTTTIHVRKAKRDAGNSRTSELVPEAVTTGMLLAGASKDTGDAGTHVKLELTPEVEWASEPLTDQPLHLQVEIQKGEPERIVVTGITPELGAPLFLAAVVLQPGTESDRKAWRESRVAVERPEGATQLVVWVAIGKELVARLKAKLPE